MANGDTGIPGLTHAPSEDQVFNPGTSTVTAPYDFFGFDPALEAQMFLQQPAVPPDARVERNRRYESDQGPLSPHGSSEEQQIKVSDYLTSVSKSSPEEIRKLQQQLKDAGYNVELTGTPDDVTLKSIEDAIQQALRAGVSLEEMLGRLKKGAQEGKTGLSSQGEDQYKRELLSTYMDIWGTPPPPGYIEKIAAQGMNVYEFGYYERQKPGYVNSPVYQNHRINAEQQLANVFGALG